jgi:hypothetical protein
MNNGSDSHTEEANRRSLAKLRRLELEGEYWEIWHWRERIRQADEQEVVHLSDCRRDRVLAYVDKLFQVSQHQADTIHRILDLVSKFTVRGWGKGQKYVSPSKLYDMICEEASYCVQGGDHASWTRVQSVHPSAAEDDRQGAG